MAIGVPAELARRRNRVFRPRDLGDIYAHPRAEVARLANAGAVRRLANGYYALVPQQRWGDHTWSPDLNAVAMGVGQADYGVDSVALMGLSAARIHGAIPRALATAVVAAPKQRPPLIVDRGAVVFVARVVSTLDVERTRTELTDGWVTTVEQTIIDLAHRPTLGGITELDAHEAIRAMTTQADWTLVKELATRSHRPSALRTALEIADA
ncbi:type IV toxin-antitoxin system AbiEi family antitoxin domain-containing protein [Actinokineospora sp. HUAS TT18]|uniref:type IV toxin-antitoxin system AbiEi family antitoxin domain-containing protein n=1 Tax=Actinokineospora sp. HUAS TT18 TaxID=3447451 RepID=UPI003F51FD05